MGLSDIAAGLTVTTRQCERGVATVDDTTESLAEWLEQTDAEIPCTPETAAEIVEAYAGGASVGAAAAVADTVPMTAAKTLHRLGTPGITPLTPLDSEILEDYLSGELTRTDAIALAGVSEHEFALGAYIATHEPLSGARDAVEASLAPTESATVAKQAELGGALESPDSLR